MQTASGNTAPIEPGSTHEAAFWVAAGGVIYLYGGEGYGTTRLGKLASTWSFVLAPICGDFIKSDAEECDEVGGMVVLRGRLLVGVAAAGGTAAAGKVERGWLKQSSKGGISCLPRDLFAFNIAHQPQP